MNVLKAGKFGGGKVLLMLLPVLLLVAAGFVFQNSRTRATSVAIPKSIVEQVLNHPQLQGFLHPEASGRVPVVISSHLVNPDLSLQKFGKPVRIVPDATLNSGAFLRFTDFEMGRVHTSVKIRYEIEGVGGSFRFRRSQDGSWKLIEAEIWET
jgi:hypothetical protein